LDCDHPGQRSQRLDRRQVFEVMRELVTEDRASCGLEREGTTGADVCRNEPFGTPSALAIRTSALAPRPPLPTSNASTSDGRTCARWASDGIDR
jgi:hypothetical protein